MQNTINTANNYGYSRKSAFLICYEILSQDCANPAWPSCKKHCGCVQEAFVSLEVSASCSARSSWLQHEMPYGLLHVSLCSCIFWAQHISEASAWDREIRMASARKGFQGLECVPVAGARARNTSATPPRWSSLTPPGYPIRALDKKNSLKNPCSDVEELK